MKAKIIDKEVLSQVIPEELTKYLRKKNWERVPTEKRKYTDVWKLEDYEIEVPLEPTFLDYYQRIAEALEVLAAVEQRSQLNIYCSICNKRIIISEHKTVIMATLSPEAIAAARKPLPPGDLVDALQDPVHTNPGRSRGAKTVRTRKS